MRPLRSSTASSQEGAAALIVVVVLFFILAMVTAYAGRNLIFEQRTSVNNQRATQAFEMAEAGLDFAIGLLSSGRVDEACRPDEDAPQTFRQRHLTMDGNGVFTLTGGQEITDRKGVKRVGLSTETVVKRSDFGFDPKAIGAIGDEALILIDCEGSGPAPAAK